MARRLAEHPTSVGAVLEEILRGCGHFESLEEAAAALARLRESGLENGVSIDSILLEHLAEIRETLESVEVEQGRLRQIIANLTTPPCFPAVYLARATVSGMQGAVIQTENDRRVVPIGEDVDADTLETGDEVLLSHERNCVIAKSGMPGLLTGEVATYSRSLGDGRFVLSSRDEEIVVIPKAELAARPLKEGDRIRFHRSAGLAFERIEASKGDDYFIESTPEDTFDEIGGMDRQIESLKRTLMLHIHHADTANKYRLPRKRSVLMEGPPGNGKTKMARATCNWLAALSSTGRARFINVKPGGLNSMWYGATEQRYREIFRIARETAGAQPDVPVVMFWDEVDAIGGHRGENAHRIDDRMLNAFMAELSGLESRGNMVILAATNRMDAIDPALLRPGRLGDLVLHFPPPGAAAARSILACHLPSGIPYAVDGGSAASARETLLDLAVAQLFTQSRQTELADLTLRDGAHRLVRAADLVSGAQLESIARSAIERACVRDAEGGPSGICSADVLAAIEEFCMCAPRILTPRNARNYLLDLPQDVDVVRVDLARHKIQQPHRYRAQVA